MNEDLLNNMAKKIRNKLIYFIHIELKKKLRDNHNLLINSHSPEELNNKYQKCSDYCVEKIETYSSNLMNDGINNNFYYVSVTFNSYNNYYHMLIDNKDITQIIGNINKDKNNYKVNSLLIRATTNKNKYNDFKNENEKKFEKIVIGNKKLMRTKFLLSSLNVIKKYSLIDSENIENETYLNNLNSNHNNYKKLINLNTNNYNKKIETIYANKLKKIKNQKIINLYSSKLKKYCSTLKILKKRGINNNSHIKTSKLNEPPLSTMNERKKFFKRGYSIRIGNEKPKFMVQHLYLRKKKIFKKKELKLKIKVKAIIKFYIIIIN